MPINNFDTFEKWVKDHGDGSVTSTKFLLSLLHTLTVSDQLEIIINENKHLIKRTSDYTWEFICDCCKGRVLAIGSDKIVPVIVKEPDNKKWYEIR